jgi:truncated hemoglobin YjbI/tellurite resistance-related uncharacterized protein
MASFIIAASTNRTGAAMGQGETIITESQITKLVDHFYGRVRRDPLIGPLFDQAVGDWPAHLEKQTRFWSSVVLGSGRYKGDPAAAHARHGARIDAAMFARWLDLWRETTDDLFSPEQAAKLQAKAVRIGESLQLAIRVGTAPRRPTAAPRSYRPYQITPAFDEASLPDALRRAHHTKPGTWGVIRVLLGKLKLHVGDPAGVMQLSRMRPGIVLPEQPHWVEPLGAMRMRIEFHDARPVV